MEQTDNFLVQGHITANHAEAQEAPVGSVHHSALQLQHNCNKLIQQIRPIRPFTHQAEHCSLATYITLTGCPSYAQRD